jgi:hypothetical protein
MLLVVGTVGPQRFHNNLSHARELILDGIPDNLVVNLVISVSQQVPHPAEAFPVWSRRDLFGIPSKTNRCLSHNLHLSFNCGFGFQIGLLRLKGHVSEETSR